MARPSVKIPKMSDSSRQVKGFSKRSQAARKRKEVLLRDEYICQHCGEAYPEYNLEADHKIPLAEGGADEVENMQTLCCTCHAKKSDSERKRLQC